MNDKLQEIEDNFCACEHGHRCLVHDVITAVRELSAEPSQAVAWLIIHDVGHDLIEKEVVFQPVDGAIPLCVCPDKK